MTVAHPIAPATAATAPAAHLAASAPTAGRDSAIDLVRAACVVVVVMLHALMAGVVLDATGPVFVNAADGAAWFAPLTWVVQIMPLFFVIGGFAGARGLDAHRARGGDATGFVAARVQRLLLPATLAVGAAGAALAALVLAGVDPAVIEIAGFRFAQPLWFLGVFLLCQALLPVLHRAHRSASLRTLGALAAAAVLVDIVRATLGVDAIGILNLAFVWLALQQIGFFLADGRIDAFSRRTRSSVGLGAAGALAVLMVTGVFSPDLFANLNPPTVALLLVGVAQTMALSLGRGALTRISLRPRVATFSDFVNARTMTIYLWHMPVVLAMAGALALAGMLFGFALPVPSSPEWWLTRPLWWAGVASLTAVLALVLAPLERRRPLRATTAPKRAARAVISGVAAVVLLLAGGTTVGTAAIATGLLILSLAQARQPRAVHDTVPERSDRFGGVISPLPTCN